MSVKAVSVSELNKRIKGLLEADPFLNDLSVEGELSNYKVYPSGHHYFSLKDKDSTLKCVMFKGAASKLTFKPESGLGVVLRGRVSVYERDGAYQLYCTGMSVSGEGDLQAAFEALKRKLETEGLFDSEHKKVLPRYPKNIAVITSSAGAAVHDIIRVLGKRWPMAKVKLLPVRVQGVEAPPEIVGALRYANKYAVGDVIIVGRGGGSIEDLWAFNDERVARAIYGSEIPVISAVGHEPDVTISDYVADVRAATPSNAAELAVPDMAELREALMSADIRAYRAARNKLERLRAQITDVSNRRVLMSPTGFVDEKRMRVDSLRMALSTQMSEKLSECKREYVGKASKLDAMSPLKVLGRGYSIARSENGGTLRDVSELNVGDNINLKLCKGSAICRVTECMEV